MYSSRPNYLPNGPFLNTIPFGDKVLTYKNMKRAQFSPEKSTCQFLQKPNENKKPNSIGFCWNCLESIDSLTQGLKHAREVLILNY
jgi:hypothetical protein